MNIETKLHAGRVVECKEEHRNGVQIGIIAGYIATWDVDRGSWGVKDQFKKGAFLESIKDHQDKGRQARFKDHHGRTIGGFPPDSLTEDSKGLFGIAEVNLDVQQGREAFSLAKQGVLTDFSVGFSSLEDSEKNIGDERIRVITKAILWEGSIVDEPMNPEANITEVKSIFSDLPISDRGCSWDQVEAEKRVADFSGDKKGAYLLSDNSFLIADVVDGNLTIIPKALFSAAAKLIKSNDMPESLKANAVDSAKKYYKKMNLDSPFDDDEKSYNVETTERNVERALKVFGFSKSESKRLSSQLKVTEENQVDNENIRELLLKEINSITQELKAS